MDQWNGGNKWNGMEGITEWNPKLEMKPPFSTATAIKICRPRRCSRCNTRWRFHNGKTLDLQYARVLRLTTCAVPVCRLLQQGRAAEDPRRRSP